MLENSTEAVHNCSRLYYAHGDDVFRESAMMDTENFRENTELKQVIDY